ncbi:MAG TPA: winged helix-turn-helix domain-containing protein [Phycisphaerae bacterium]|nr:winged helix-turn-helix domain-containing protein [Phycisphaerae bacterium]HNU46881.1 winged helix-turn-helix domain-containing protein [Phycisphaerae bacterium]
MTGASPKQRRKQVLVVEDEVDLAEMICFNLQKEGYDCSGVPSGDLALHVVRRTPPNLIILDRMLPGKSGDEVVAQLKRDPATASIPVMMLTAKVEEVDQLVGFALGADDYVTKPFSMKVLVARVGALLRRLEMRADEPDALSAGPIRLVASRHEVAVEDQAVILTATEFKLLRALLVRPGRVLERNTLLDLMCGTGAAVADRTIDVHITALRKKLGPAAGWIQTVRGVGYTVRAPRAEQDGAE